jgi:acyl-CoA reductase-like NAD-dependent aldehyde dehydrogenase
MDMLIDDRWVPAGDDRADAVLSKSDGRLIDTVPHATASDVRAALSAAQKGKRLMARLPAHERYAILMKAADAMAAQQERLANLLVRENGRTLREVRQELNAALRIIRGYAEEALRQFGRVTPLDSIPGHDHSLALSMRQPRGVVLAIVPFNYPIELWAHKLAGALAAGNAVITKPPEQCPLTILQIAELLRKAGLPPAAHQVITGPGETVGAALVRGPGVDMVAMTGSTAAGRAILVDAAATMTKVHLELGGNDATIVCADADLSQVADGLIRGRFTSGNGQICCAVKRVLIDRAIFDRVVEEVLARTRALRVGDPLDESTDVGPLISEEAAAQVEAQLVRAVAAGARVLAGGRRKGAFFEPTVLTDVTAESPVFSEEIFGPVLPLIAVDGFDQALELANRGPWGLQAAIFTRDMGRIMRAFRELDVGTVVVNHSTAIRLENLPFGGNRHSGNGREGLHETLLEMTEQKTLLLNQAFEAI